MTLYKRYFFFILAVSILSGCGSKSTMESFLRDEVDLTHVLKVAVAPFENNTKEQYAPERVRGIAITEILSQGLYDVVDKGLVDSAFREEAVDLSKAPMDAGVIKRIGQRLNVQALMMGSIDQAGIVQRGQNSYPELALTLRLVDVNSGMIFWQASGNESGNSLGKRLFGLGSDDEFKVSLRLLRRLLATISSDRKVKLPSAVTAAPVEVVPAEEEKPQEEEAAQSEPEPEAEPEAEPEPEPEAEEQVVPMGEEESLEELSPLEEVAPSAEEAPAVEEDEMKPAEASVPVAEEEDDEKPV
ncbi:MAG: hypothetical protein FP815_13740, partial [Desulfobulbaceae bacterium]|nr:hypothetical protein [Desulfobulbaceae bacterium]